MDYDSEIHSAGLGVATIGVLAWQQLWLPLVALAVVVGAAVLIRFTFRRGKRPTDV